MPAHTHIHRTPPPMTETELAAARWEDDGGPVIEPRPESSTGQWLRISAAMTRRLPDIAGREDLIVTCEPRTRSGAPAAFFPSLATVEIDTAIFAPHHPAALDPNRLGDEERYPAAWGAFVHEAAHAAHSTWITPPAVRGTAVGFAAEMLEESRAEHAHITRRPADRRYLRACVGELVMPGFTATTPTDTWQAAYAAGLILARRDAGILDPDETDPLEQAVTSILGEDLLATLAAIWQAAHKTDDDDGQAMLEHARAWCAALNADPDQPEPTSISSSADGGRLTAAIEKVVGHVAVSEAAQAAIAAAAAQRAKAKAAAAARQRQGAEIAGNVFTRVGRPFTPGEVNGRSRATSPVTGTRPPTGAEKSAAGQLARALRAAAYRERVETITASAAPPGRLSMRGALARDAQRAAGATPTALPWIHTHRRQTPSPPLRVGIAVDVSGSMNAATDPIASAAWIVAKAAALTDPDSRTAAIAYDRSLTAITAPGRTPGPVTEFTARGLGHSLAEAIDALSAGLDLTKPGTGRLLVIASDGYYSPTEAAKATDRVQTLRDAGCAVLWLAFAPDPCPLPDTTLLELTDPAHAAGAIAKAATAAITASR